ncbi:MAG TPA: flagellar hook-length control protein FliK [Steroidobacteraceae bacterium]|nr:flagellar hook-length control protein FliK [Steroidobacteraceae bacterium]
MTPTNLPVQPATPATPTQGSVATATEQAQTTDFLAMLGQLVAASVQRTGTVVAPTSKVPAMFLDSDAKKDEVDPEQLLAMFSMAVPPQVHPINIEVPVGQALQALSGVSIPADAAEGSVQNILQEVAKQITDSKLFADVAIDAQGTTTTEAPDAPQVPTLPVQLQPHQVTGNVHDPVSRPIHAPVGTPAWADEIGARVVMMSESGNHTASLKLSPEHLGPLEINITVRDDKASVWFGAAHADTRAAIETALPRLREMFASQGLSLADAGVFREPPREQQVVRNTTTSAGQGETTEEVATVSARARVGLVDAYA